MSLPAISATGLRKSYGDTVVLDGIDLDVAPGTIFSLLGPNGAGKTTTVNILSTLTGADAGTASVGGHDVAADPDGVRTVIGLTGQFSAVDNLLTGEENLFLMADLHHLPRREGRRRAAELLERFDLTDVAKKTPRDLLRRHAAQARPGDDAGRRPEGDLPRRADDRAGPAQPPRHVGHHPRPGRQRRDDLPHHAVPRRGRPPRRPDRRPRPRPARRAGHARRAQAPAAGRPPPAAVRRPGPPHRGGAPARRVHTGRRGARAAGADRRHRGARCGRCSTGSTPPRSRSTR